MRPRHFEQLVYQIPRGLPTLPRFEFLANREIKSSRIIEGNGDRRATEVVYPYSEDVLDNRLNYTEQLKGCNAVLCSRRLLNRENVVSELASFREV